MKENCEAYSKIDSGTKDILEVVATVRDLGASKSAACEQLIQQYALNENEANEKIEMYWTD